MTALKEQPRPPRPVYFRWSTVITLLVLVSLLVAGFLYGKRVLDGDVNTRAGCEVVRLDDGKLHARHVLVNVYNAGARAGIAATTGASLRQRGFNVGTIGNDEETGDVQYVTLRGHATDAPEVRLVLAQFTNQNQVQVVADQRADRSVDIVAGYGFRTLMAAKALAIAVPEGEACIPQSVARTADN